MLPSPKNLVMTTCSGFEGMERRRGKTPSSQARGNPKIVSSLRKLLVFMDVHYRSSATAAYFG